MLLNFKKFDFMEEMESLLAPNETTNAINYFRIGEFEIYLKMCFVRYFVHYSTNLGAQCFVRSANIASFAMNFDFPVFANHSI